MRDELVAVRRDGGDDHHITRGYGALVAALADGLTIHLQTPIHRVSHDVSGVALQCADGSIVRANRVVVTVPLAILKRGVMTFSPALPPEKTAAIAALDMGSACKMILQFRAPFWDAGAAFFTLPDPAPVWWTIDPARPILVGLFTGPRADALRAAADPREFCMTVLRTVFGAVVDDTLVAATLVDWTAEAWTGGGYSSVPVGALWARAALAHPVGRVHFAGEATAVDGHPASVHGALVSGERAAQEILDADR
jgi:monoamine oxidase